MIDTEKVCLSCFKTLKTQKSICLDCGCDNSTISNESHQLECGSILAGTYLIGKVLGQGGFGITYVGWDLNLEIKVAIKEYYPEGCVTRDTHTHVSVLTYAGPKEAFFQKGKERFVGEARALAKFSGDSGVVGVRAFFYENGTAYIVMDYVEGETLKAYAARVGGKMPSAQVLSLFQPLICSLARVHESGLLHRDISPDNIMLKPDGSLALLDFGAARQISIAGEHSNTINVKHGFAPEEQYRTRGEQGPWTDIYALCATIYRLTTGVTPVEALDRMANDEPLALPSAFGADFSHTQELALMHGLALRAIERTQSMLELAIELYQETGTDISVAQSSHQSQSAVTNTKEALIDAITNSNNMTGGETQESGKEQTCNSERAGKARRTKKLGVIFASAAALVTAIIVSATMIQRQTQRNELQQVSDNIYAKNYASALAIAEDIKLKNADFDEAIYGFTLNLIDKGAVDAAKKMKYLIVDATVFDMVPVEDGITIGRIRDLLARGEYEQAELLLPRIQKPGSYDIAEIKKEIATQEIDSLISNNSFQEALIELAKLESIDLETVSELIGKHSIILFDYAISLYQTGDIANAEYIFSRIEEIDQYIASELISNHSSVFYNYAISLYRNGDFSIAEYIFSRLNSYQRTSDYMLLIDCSKRASRGISYSDQDYYITKSQFEKLVLIADFENAGELLFTNSDTAFLFLEGEWTSESSYMKFDISASNNMNCIWHIDGSSSGTFSMAHGKICVIDPRGLKNFVARFTVIDQNSLEIFIYDREQKYSFKRS